MLIRKIALLLVYSALLLSQGCALMPSGYSPMSQPSTGGAQDMSQQFEDRIDDELSRPSGG